MFNFFEETPSSMRKLIYTKEHGSIIFRFYVDNGHLRASIIKEDKAELFVSITGFPAAWKTSLDTAEHLEKIIKVLSEDAYFRYNGHSVAINARGVGGWGTLVHAGLRPKLLPVHPTYINPNTGQRYVSFSIVNGTFDWLQEFGFSKDVAFKIGRANEYVDSGLTDPTNLTQDQSHLTFAQSWHFNTKGGLGGSTNDSRIQHAITCLHKAVACFDLTKNLSDDVLAWLGLGLHPLQDVFAHTDAYVTKQEYDDGSQYARRTFFHHINPARGTYADCPKYLAHNQAEIGRSPPSFLAADQDIPVRWRYQPSLGATFTANLRYADTQTVTYLYMLAFIETVNLKCKIQVANPNITNQLINRICFRDSVNEANNQGCGRIRDANVSNFNGFIDALEPLTSQGLQLPAPIITHIGTLTQQTSYLNQNAVEDLTNQSALSTPDLAGMAGRTVAALTIPAIMHGGAPTSDFWFEEANALLDKASHGFNSSSYWYNICPISALAGNKKSDVQKNTIYVDAINGHYIVRDHNGTIHRNRLSPGIVQKLSGNYNNLNDPNIGKAILLETSRKGYTFHHNASEFDLLTHVLMNELMYQELNASLQGTLGPNSLPPPGESSNSQGESKETLVPDDKGKEEEEEKKSSGLNSSASLFQPQSLNQNDNDEERDESISESSTTSKLN
jgi:hypothetical protein